MRKRMLYLLQIVLLVFLLSGCDLFKGSTTTSVNTTTAVNTTTSLTTSTSTNAITTTSVVTTLPTTTQTTTDSSSLGTFTIEFEENGGTVVEDIIGLPGTSISEPDEPVRVGYIFCGWFEDFDLTMPYTFDVIPDTNIAIYAKWIAEDDLEGIVDEMGFLFDQLSLDASSVSIADMSSILQAYDILVNSAVSGSQALGYYSAFLTEIQLAYVRDYVKIDFEYAKSTAVDLMEASMGMFESFITYGMIDSISIGTVLTQYTTLIDNATTIEYVDIYLEAFINDLTAALVFNNTPPIEIVIGFRAQAIAHLNDVMLQINSAGDEIGIIAVTDVFMTNLEATINASDSIPDISEFTWYGLRQMFQDLTESSRSYFESEVTAAYNGVVDLLSGEMLSLLNVRYAFALNLVDNLQFLYDIDLVTKDFKIFVDLITP